MGVILRYILQPKKHSLEFLEGNRSPSWFVPHFLCVVSQGETYQLAMAVHQYFNKPGLCLRISHHYWQGHEGAVKCLGHYPAAG